MEKEELDGLILWLRRKIQKSRHKVMEFTKYEEETGSIISDRLYYEGTNDAYEILLDKLLAIVEHEAKLDQLHSTQGE